MPPDAVRCELRARGVVFRLEDGRVRWLALPGVITPEAGVPFSLYPEQTSAFFPLCPAAFAEAERLADLPEGTYHRAVAEAYWAYQAGRFPQQDEAVAFIAAFCRCRAPRDEYRAGYLDTDEGRAAAFSVAVFVAQGQLGQAS